MDIKRMNLIVAYTVIKIVDAIKILQTVNIEKIDNDKFKNKMYCIYVSGALESILRTLSQVKTSNNKLQALGKAWKKLEILKQSIIHRYNYLDGIGIDGLAIKHGIENSEKSLLTYLLNETEEKI
nr:MAG TPA: hypothetical protein [Caudoviricetes sp.]